METSCPGGSEFFTLLFTSIKNFIMFSSLKILRHLFLSSLATISCCAMSSCIFEGIPACDYGTSKVNFVLNLNIYDRLFEYQYIDTIDFFTRADSSDWTMKYWVGIYREGSEEPFQYIPTTSQSVDLSLFPGNYTFVAWAEPVPDPSGPTFYFHTDDFSEMLLKNKFNYQGNDFLKTPYRVSEEISILPETPSVDLTLTPAFARYRLIANDRHKIEYKPSKIKVSYYNLPAAVHALNGNLSLKWNDVNFTSTFDDILLAFDHVLSHNSEETSISLKVEIYDDENNIKARVNPLTIPLINGGITTVTGNFFSVLASDDDFSSGNSGVLIDDEWEGSVELTY